MPALPVYALEHSMATTFLGTLPAASPRKPALVIADTPPGVVHRDGPRIEISELLLEAGAILLTREPISLDNDLYVYGTRDQPLHPLLVDALLLVVDRRRRRIDPPARQGQHRPLFLIEKEDGRYVCGLCSIDGDTLVIEPHPDIPARSQRLKKEDTTTIGQVVAVVRRFDAAPHHV